MTSERNKSSSTTCTHFFALTAHRRLSSAATVDALRPSLSPPHPVQGTEDMILAALLLRTYFGSEAASIPQLTDDEAKYTLTALPLPGTVLAAAVARSLGRGRPSVGV